MKRIPEKLRPLIAAVLPVMPFLLSMAVAAAFGDRASSFFRYDRAAIASGQVWRLLTAHFVHLNGMHFLVNGTAIVALAALDRPHRFREWALRIFFCAAGVSAGLWFFEYDIAWYAGFSGVAHGLFAIVSVGMILRRSPTGFFLLAALAAKVICEAMGGTTLADLTMGFHVVVSAHLFGAISGAAYALLPRLIRRTSRV